MPQTPAGSSEECHPQLPEVSLEGTLPQEPAGAHLRVCWGQVCGSPICVIKGKLSKNKLNPSPARRHCTLSIFLKVDLQIQI